MLLDKILIRVSAYLLISLYSFFSHHLFGNLEEYCWVQFIGRTSYRKFLLNSFITEVPIV